MTFTHRFSDTLSCTLTLKDGETLMHSIEWTGEPLQIHRGEFIRWLHVTYRYISDTLGAELTPVIHDGPLARHWLYRPFRVPRLVKTTRD
jgi:hypothetical protein